MRPRFAIRDSVQRASEAEYVSIEGLTTIGSSFGRAETLTRLQAAIRANGMQVLARLDRAAAPLEQGEPLDTTTVVMFGNRGRQAALVKALPLMALDLPFRALVWQDAGGQDWISYNDFRWLAKRYGAAREDAWLFTDLGVMIDGIVRKASSPP
jgi:uncharacterized protein (DUF302 family)